jgi:hypothetical protein
VKKELPKDGRVRVNVALQVAGIAAQVVAALRSGSQDRCNELESKLALAQSQLHPLEAPPGLIPFIDVMRGLLRKEDVSARAGGLPPSYRATYEQVVDSTQHKEDEGELTVRQVMDQVAHNVIMTMEHGTLDQRQQMANVLFKMEQEAEQRPHLIALADLVKAARILLEGGDPSSIAEQLKGPFREKWEHIVDTLEIRQSDV